MVLKAFSLLLSATKVGRWQAGEKTLQVDFPSGDVACQMGRAPWQGQGICRTAYSHFRSFRNCSGSDHIVRFSSLSQLQAHSKHKEKWWYVEIPLSVLQRCFQKHLLWSETNLSSRKYWNSPLCCQQTGQVSRAISRGRCVKLKSWSSALLVQKWTKASLQRYRHPLSSPEDMDWTPQPCTAPLGISTEVHPLHLSWGPQFLPELWHRNTQVLPALGWSWFTAWTLWFDLSRDSSPGIYLTVQIWPWMESVIMSPMLSSVLWDCSLVGEATVPARCVVTLSSQFIFPCGTALLLLAPDNEHPTLPVVILLSFIISTYKPKCKVSPHAFPKGVLQGLLYSHFLYLSKTLSTPLYCASYEMKRIAPFRSESCEEYKPCTPIGNEDSTTLL